ncbi:MAG: oxidoreductase of aldo/keto reductase family, subgroup 1, partial [uncultured Rubrobacteraceae bacterium]
GRSSRHNSQRWQHHPAARFRGLPDRAGRHRAGGGRGARDRLPAHRHRADVRQRERGR